MADEEQEVRPRFGVVTRVDGTEESVYFRPFEDEDDSFIPIDPITDEPVALGPGDTIRFDALGPGQSIMAMKANTAEMREGRTKRGWKESQMEKKEKDPNGWWKGLVVLAGICAIVVLTIAGVNWALSL